MKQILRRAGELQSASTSDASQPTLTQLQEAAAELGLSPDLVAQAAAELGSRPPPGTFLQNLFGGPTSVERTVDVAARLTPEVRPIIAQKIRDATALAGEVKFLGDSLDFVYFQEDSGLTRSFVFTVTPMGDTTRLSVRACYMPAYAFHVFLLIPFVPMMVLISKHPTSSHLAYSVGLFFACIAMIGTFMSTRWMVRQTVSGARGKIDGLLADVASTIEGGSVAVPNMTAPAVTPEPAAELRTRLG